MSVAWHSRIALEIECELVAFLWSFLQLLLKRRSITGRPHICQPKLPSRWHQVEKLLSAISQNENEFSSSWSALHLQFNLQEVWFVNFVIVPVTSNTCLPEGPLFAVFQVISLVISFIWSCPMSTTHSSSSFCSILILIVLFWEIFSINHFLTYLPDVRTSEYDPSNISR